VQVRVPDIGDFKDVTVIEVLVKPGDAVKAEQSLITVESDKAAMEIPSSARRRGAGAQGQGRRQGQASATCCAILQALRCGQPPRAAPAAALHPPAAAAAGVLVCACIGRTCRQPAPPWPARPMPRRRALGAAACLAVGAQVRARARCAAGRGQGQRSQGPHHRGRRAGLHPLGDGRHGADGGHCGQAPAARQPATTAPAWA